jgi:queuine tRNA-ribosyltransferase
LGSQLNTVHNLHFYQRHMSAIRGAIEAEQLDAFSVEFYARQAQGV